MRSDPYKACEQCYRSGKLAQKEKKEAKEISVFLDGLHEVDAPKGVKESESTIGSVDVEGVCKL